MGSKFGCCCQILVAPSVSVKSSPDEGVHHWLTFLTRLLSCCETKCPSTPTRQINKGFNNICCIFKSFLYPVKALGNIYDLKQKAHCFSESHRLCAVLAVQISKCSAWSCDFSFCSFHALKINNKIFIELQSSFQIFQKCFFF